MNKNKYINEGSREMQYMALRGIELFQNLKLLRLKPNEGFSRSVLVLFLIDLIQDILRSLYTHFANFLTM